MKRMKEIKIIVILLLYSNCLFSQVDSIKSQILNYEDSKSTIISKGRKLLLDKFVEGDLGKVKEVKDYLVKTEDDDYFAFYPTEHWLILYWTKDYAELAESIQNFDSLKQAGYSSKIRPLKDMLYDKLNEKSFENETKLKQQILDSELEEEVEQMLILNLDWLLIDNREEKNAQDYLNAEADSFRKTYSASRFNEFIGQFIRFKLVPKEWGMAFEFFSGYSVFTQNLSNTYSNNVPMGIAFDVLYKNFELYLRNYIGFAKTKQDLNYSLGVWEKDSRVMVFLPEASLGYVAYNDNRLKFSPFAGIGSMDISPTTNDTEKIAELKEVSLEFTTTYVLGINFDIKFGPKNTPDYIPKTNYGFIRVRYAYAMPRFEKFYDGMTGNMHYITIGFGGVTRGLRRELN